MGEREREDSKGEAIDSILYITTRRLQLTGVGKGKKRDHGDWDGKIPSLSLAGLGRWKGRDGLRHAPPMQATIQQSKASEKGIKMIHCVYSYYGCVGPHWFLLNAD